MGDFVKKIKNELKQAIKDHPKHNQKSVAALVGKTTSYLSQVLNDKRKGSFEFLVKIAAIVGYRITNQNPSPATTTTIIERTHIELIPGFKNKQMALEINRKLQKIERLDPDKLAYINHTCDEWLREIEYKKKKEEEIEPGEPAGGTSSEYPRKSI